MAEELSFRGYARRRGVSDMAVRKRVKSGCLVKSVGRLKNGKIGIVSAQVADREWEATTSRARAGAPEVGLGSKRKASAEPPEAVRSEPSEGSRDGSHGSQSENGQEEPAARVPAGRFISSATLVDAQTQATNERARKLKLDNDMSEGRLISVELIEKEAFEAERVRREAVLNLPARISSELAAEWGLDSNKVYVRLDQILRSALKELSGAFRSAVGE